MEFCLTQSDRVLLGPIEYSKGRFAAALAHHGITADLLPESAPTEALQLHHLRLLPTADLTDRPEPAAWYHIGQPVLTVTESAVERRCPVKPYPVDYCVDLLEKAVGAHKWRTVEAGIKVNGVPVLTAESDRTTLLQTTATVESGRIPSVPWKSPTGFIDATAELLVPLRDAVEQHVQVCFERERDLHSEIETALQKADPHAALLAIDWKAGWPPTLADKKAEQPDPA